MDDYPLLSAYLRPHPALDPPTDRGIDGWRRDIGKLQLWGLYAAVGCELTGSLRVHRHDGQGGQWRAQSVVRPRQQCVVDNLYTHLSIQDLLRPCGDFPRRNHQHDTRTRVRPEWHKQDTDPRLARGGHLVLRVPFLTMPKRSPRPRACRRRTAVLEPRRSPA